MLIARSNSTITTPGGHVALGYLAITDRQTDEAVRHLQTALDLNPNFAAAYSYLGLALEHDGRSDDALHHFEQAIRMIPRDPLNGAFFSGSAAAHYIAGRYSDAVKCARQAVQLRYGLPAAHRILCASLAQAGQVEEARSALSTLQRLQPDLSVAWIRESVPFTPSPMAHFLDGMRKAGLTE